MFRIICLLYLMQRKMVLLALSRLWGVVWAVSKVESLAHAPASPSEVYPAGKLQRHFTCGFDFGHIPWGAINSFCGIALSRWLGVLGAVARVEGSAHALVSPSGVYFVGEPQWHFTCGFYFGHGLWGVVNSSCGNGPFRAVGVSGAVSGVGGSGVRALLAFRGLCCC